jgi:hypothetical protein
VVHCLVALLTYQNVLIFHYCVLVLVRDPGAISWLEYPGMIHSIFKTDIFINMVILQLDDAKERSRPSKSLR